MNVKLSEKMDYELRYAADFYQNSCGVVVYCLRRTEDALIRRGLIAYTGDARNNNYPVITVAGWEYLASKGVNRRAEDPGRLTLEEALNEAYAGQDEVPAVKVSAKMDDELQYATQGRNSQGALFGCPAGTERALIRQGLITYDYNRKHKTAVDFSTGLPALTVAGWEYLASKGIARPADYGRLTLEEALEEAYPARPASRRVKADRTPVKAPTSAEVDAMFRGWDKPRKLRVLDLFCGAGGAGKGYADAGFEVVGVDIHPQPDYPFEFHQGDAVEFVKQHGAEFDFIHASPPCQKYSAAQRIQGREHPDLIGPARDVMNSTGRPWVLENVEDALPWMRGPVLLCGASFGLHTYRHRYFETGCGFVFPAPEHEEHKHTTVKMGRSVQPGDWYHAVGNFSGVGYVRADMQVHWMNRDGIRECIPPAYSRYIGAEFLKWSESNG